VRHEPEQSDDDLMRLTANGDQGAFRLLVERWENPVQNFMARMLGDADDALDLSQESFLRLWSTAGRYRPSGRFRSWLFRIAGNLARSRLRRRRILRWVRLDLAQHDLPAPDLDSERALEREETQAIMRRAISRLPDRQRQAILLRRYQGMSYREVAGALGCSVPAVESLLQRAMVALRRDLEGKVGRP